MPRHGRAEAKLDLTHLTIANETSLHFAEALPLLNH